MTKITTGTIERSSPGIFNDAAKWSIFFHTDLGREEFGRYRTKKEAFVDAREYDIHITNR